jgi:hypothetical protein
MDALGRQLAGASWSAARSHARLRRLPACWRVLVGRQLAGASWSARSVLPPPLCPSSVASVTQSCFCVSVFALFAPLCGQPSEPFSLQITRIPRIKRSSTEVDPRWNGIVSVLTRLASCKILNRSLAQESYRGRSEEGILSVTHPCSSHEASSASSFSLQRAQGRKRAPFRLRVRAPWPL